MNHVNPEDPAMTEKPALTVPTVHLNGTARSDLADGYIEALSALKSAKKCLQDAAPNGRDYYPQGGDAIGKAMKEHWDRLARVEAVISELEVLAEAVAYSK